MTDPITDMFNRIKNAQAVDHPTVDIPWSGIKYEIAKILEKNGFIEGAERRGRHPARYIRVVLKYESQGSSGVRPIPAIRGLRRISKPGQRIYLASQEIKKVRGGTGIAIISTPQGVMTGKEARKQKVGGEVLCEVW